MNGKIILALGVALIYAPTLFAKTYGTYIGVGLARATAHVKDMTLETLPYSYILNTKPIGFKTNQSNTSPNSTLTIFGGYEINRYFTLEAFYQPLGEYNREASFYHAVADTNEISKLGFGLQPPGIAMSDIDRLKLQGYGLTALLTYPVTNYLHIIGKLGGMYWTGTLERSTSFFQQNVNGTKIGTLLSSENGSGFSPAYGLGIRIDITRGLSVGAEYTYFSSVGSGLSTGKTEANVSSLTAQVNF